MEPKKGLNLKIIGTQNNVVTGSDRFETDPRLMSAIRSVDDFSDEDYTKIIHLMWKKVGESLI